MGMHSFRTDDEIWASGMTRAASEGTTLSAVLTAALAAYAGVTPAVSLADRVVELEVRQEGLEQQLADWLRKVVRLRDGQTWTDEEGC